MALCASLAACSSDSSPSTATVPGSADTTAPAATDTAAAAPVSAVPASDPAQPGPFGVGTWETTVEGLGLIVWYPTDGGSDAPSADGPFPLIMFSHGASSAPTSSSFLTEHLASHGFVVAAVAHPNDGGLERRAEDFANRPDEVHAAVDLLLAESATPGATLEGTIDPDRLGVTGHSFGGLTTIALLGEDDSRFAAGLPMAPGIRPGDPADVTDDLTRITVPVLMMMGQADVLAQYANLSAAYATIPDTTTRYALVLPDATHQTFNNGCGQMCPAPGTLELEDAHRIITTHATAFFQLHLRGQDDYATYLESRQDIDGGLARLSVGAIQP